MKTSTIQMVLIGLFAISMSWSNVSAQCLVTTGPTHDCSYGDAIDEITIDGTTAANAGCSSPSGYSSFATPTWTFDLGTSYALNVLVGGAQYSQGLSIWIDIDNNGEFAASEQVYASPTFALTHTGTITIPATAATGVPLPMRVMCAYNTTIAGNQACTTVGSYGETEDYMVTITSSTLPSNVEATAIYEPFDGDCGVVNDEVWVTITNTTASVEDTVPVQLNLSGMITATYYDTIFNMAGSAIENLMMATIDTESGGVLNAELIINLGDDDATDDTLQVAINIASSLDLMISGSDTLCFGDTTAFSVNNLVGETYTWNLDGAFLSNGNSSSFPVTMASAQLVVTSDNACRMNDTLDFVGLSNPAVAFTASITDFDADFSATGSDYNTISWDFGDGGSDTGLTPQHTYAQNGDYIVCATAQGDCGTDVFCDTITIASTIGLEEFKGATVSVYPNPTADEVKIDLVSFEGLSGEWKLYNLDGKEILSGKVDVKSGNESIVISLEQFASGTYLFKMSNKNGRIYEVELVRN